MGFAGVILWALMPVRSLTGVPVAAILGDLLIGLARKEIGAVCPYTGSYGACQDMAADERIAELPSRYDAVDTALRELVGIQGISVVINQYPNPLRNAADSLCGDNPNANINNAWYGTRMLIPAIASPKSWQLNLTQWEAQQVEAEVVPYLNQTIAASAVRHAWIATNQSGSMSGHGWCTGDHIALVAPSAAAQFKPYDERVRRIQTGTDSFLTQWPGPVDRNDGLSGTIHPNVYGYASMADAALTAIKATRLVGR